MDREQLDREMWSLNKAEADAVKKRVDTLSETLKKRRQKRVHVRDVFASPTQVNICNRKYILKIIILCR